jgi:hypothetical protein
MPPITIRVIIAFYFPLQPKIPSRRYDEVKRRWFRPWGDCQILSASGVRNDLSLLIVILSVAKNLPYLFPRVLRAPAFLDSSLRSE